MCIVFASSLLACGDDGGSSADAMVNNTIDAAGNQPDAAGGNPDAAPGTPDAAPGTPDALVGTPDALGTPDAGTPDAGTPDAMEMIDANIQQITITQSVDPATITPANSVSCNAAGIHADNRYFRVFDLATFGITSDFMITNVQIGIEQAVAADVTGQPIEVVVHTLAGQFVLANLTTIHTEPVTVLDAAEVLLDIPVATTVPAGSVLVLEIHTPDGQIDGHTFFFGSNANGENDDSYIVADACGITEVTTMTAIGFANVQLVESVTGNYIP